MMKQQQLLRLLHSSRRTVSVIIALASATATVTHAQTTAAAPPRPAFTLTTSAFLDGTDIPLRFTQAGAQTSPALTWTNVPAGTVSFVVQVRDPDVARNKTIEDQLHWLVWNIPATATGLPEGVPAGAELADGSHQISASGPSFRGPGASASGPRHHYTFEVYALDTKLDAATSADAFETRANVMKAMQGHVLGKAVYVGLFHRP
jgi:Raf kinase inhibitor-like YbhB/YbcL family protein